MLFELDIDELEIKTAIESEFAEEAERVIRDVVRMAPAEMQSLMREGGTSKSGEPPRKRTGGLKGSLKARLVDKNTVEVSMIDYGGYLDPLFKDQDFKGAGWANRPFIEKGFDNAIEKAI